MAGEKVKVLGLERDYKKFIYYIDAQGSVCRKAKQTGGGIGEVVVSSAITREPGWLYYIDKEGDVSRSPMARKKASA